MFGELLIIGSFFFFFVRFHAQDGKDRAVYDMLSALLMFFGWIFIVWSPQSVIYSTANSYTLNTISGNLVISGQTNSSTVTGDFSIPVYSAQFVLSLTLVISYLIIMSMFMVRDIVMSRPAKED